MNGLTQETCRDFVHTGYGISSISHVAETAGDPGARTCYPQVGERLRQALGLPVEVRDPAPGVPSNLCGGS